MKKLSLMILTISGLSFGGAAWAQSSSPLSTVSKALSDFSQSVAPALPSLAASSLTWSDAYIGQLIALPPHFGVGASVQAIFLPIKGIDSLFSAFGIAEPAPLTAFGSLGVPFPAYAVEARIGGIVLPFDLGLKFGTIPTNVSSLTGSFAINYLLWGAELRWDILKDAAIVPGLSIGASYSNLSGAFYYTMSDITLGSVPTGPSTTSNIALSKPTVGFEWQTSVVELNAQISKNLVVITPYAGVGASLSWAKAGGGFYATPTIGGAAMTQAQMAYLQSNFPNNPAVASVTNSGIDIQFQQSNVFSFRAFGGVSINIVIVRLDLGVSYNFSSQSLGGDFGLRFQL